MGSCHQLTTVTVYHETICHFDDLLITDLFLFVCLFCFALCSGKC